MNNLIINGISWMHKQAYIFKKARELKKSLKTKQIEASVFECAYLQQLKKMCKNIKKYLH